MKIHFYPFNTITRKIVESYANTQGIYIDSYPGFLCTIFSEVQELQVFSYTNNFAKDSDTGEIGFCNWEIADLTHMTSVNNYPMEGFAVTGFLYFSDTECEFQLIILDLEKKEIFRGDKRKFDLDELFTVVVHETVYTIGRISQMPDQLFGQIVAHESLLKHPSSFLWHLYILGVLSKKEFFPDLFTTEKMLLAFQECFTVQPDFLVMEYVFQDFAGKLADHEKSEFKNILDEISRLVKKN
jgi:hypothetical protein